MERDLIVKARQQAQAQVAVASLRIVLDGTIPPPPKTLQESSRRRKRISADPPAGELIIGPPEPSLVSGNLTSYKLLPGDVSSNWDILLNNVMFNSSSLGYNGVVTVTSSQFWSAVPSPLFSIMTSLLNITGGTVEDGDSWRTYSFDCNAATYPTGLPNITYFMDGKTLVFTPSQYIYADKVAERCYLSFAVNLDGSVPFPYTIATALMNGTYTIYDAPSQTFSSGYASLN